MKGVNKAVGPHSCACGFSRLQPACLMSRGSAGSWHDGWWHQSLALG